MTKIRACLIQEVRGFDASFRLFRDALCRGGIEMVHHIDSSEGLQSLPWCGDSAAKMTDLDFDVLFLGSLPLPTEKDEREKAKKDWAKCIRTAIECGAGLVAMLDWSTATILATLDLNGDLLPIHFKKLAPTLNPDVRGVIFRPRLTLEGRTHQATKDMVNKNLPPFGSLTRSYYRTVKQEKATMLMEIPESVDDCAYPFLTVRKVRDQANGPGIAIMAADWCNTGGQEFIRWPDASILLSTLGRWAAGKEGEEPISAQPAHWFVRCDREQSIENWKDMIDAQGQLLQPKTVETTTVTDSVQAGIESNQAFEQTYSDAPMILQGEKPDDDMLVAKLCNGIIVRLNKSVMQVRYCLNQNEYDAVVKADVPIDSNPPRIFDPWPWSQVHYYGYRFIGERLEVTYKLGYNDGNKPSSYLFWTFIPTKKVIEGVEWTCVGEQFALQTHESVELFCSPPHLWRLGDKIECHSTYRFACYGEKKRRGFIQTRFDKETTSDPFHWFCEGQPFQMLTYSSNDRNRTLWCYTTTAAAIRSEMHNRSSADKYIQIDLSALLGRQTGNIQLPTFWYCFAERDFSHNLWLAAYDHIRHHFRKEYGIKRTYPRPTAMLRYHFTNLNELRNYADTFVPLAKELGFKRIECGVRYVNDLFFPLHGGLGAFRYLCDKAHEAGIEVIFYCGASWHHDVEMAKCKLPSGKEIDCGPSWRQEGQPFLGSGCILEAWRNYEITDGQLKLRLWVNREEQSDLKGTECHRVDGLPRRIVILSLRSSWYQASLEFYKALKDSTGINGVWLDSWTMPNQHVNYAEPAPAPAVAEAMHYVADLQKLGYMVLVEGQSPAALESFWYRQASYAPLQGNEFSLSGMSPFASNGDGLLDLDLFRLLAYGCAMFQDIRLLADATDDVVSEVTKLARACNKLMNSIHEKLGMPLRVRELSVADAKIEDPIGTFWECEKGIAIFGLRTANQLRIDLPSTIASHVPVEQHDIRSPEGTTNMQIRSKEESEDGHVYLEGQLAAGGVVIVQAALGNESTDIYLPIIQR